MTASQLPSVAAFVRLVTSALATNDLMWTHGGTDAAGQKGREREGRFGEFKVNAPEYMNTLPVTVTLRVLHTRIKAALKNKVCFY